jgi:oxaloacetate decarboxylase alpha subunit
VPALVDTTIRLLGQEPLAGSVPASTTLRLAEILDRAGFAYLEVSGGGCFDTAVRRGVESPWERIRAIKQRTTTPLAIAVRGRFLVGGRPVGGNLARRFVACAAESGIDVFRLHDPLNDISNLTEAAGAITAAGREFAAGLVYSPGRGGDPEALAGRAVALRELGATRILVHDPSGSLRPGSVRELVVALREASGLPIGLYCQGAAGNAFATALEGARAGADQLACTIYPVAVALSRPAGETLSEALTGLGNDAGIDGERLWQAAALVGAQLGDAPVTPLAPWIATQAAHRQLPPGLISALDQHLRAFGAADRLDEVLDELARVREEAGRPPLASPIGQILGSQALLHVLTARRYGTVVDQLRELLEGEYGTPPGEIDDSVLRAIRLTYGELVPREPVDIEQVRADAGGLAAAEEDLLLLALFGADARALLETMRDRGSETLAAAGVEQERADRIREIVRIVQESGVAEVTIEEGDLKVSVRRTDDRPAAAAAAARAPLGDLDAPGLGTVDATSLPGLHRVESPMVGTFYRASSPATPAFAEVGATIAAGQTLCILEAMKLMNEVKSEIDGIVRAIHVGNGDPVEFGQLLFELEPVGGPPTL